MAVPVPVQLEALELSLQNENTRERLLSTYLFEASSVRKREHMAERETERDTSREIDRERQRECETVFIESHWYLK